MINGKAIKPGASSSSATGNKSGMSSVYITLIVIAENLIYFRASTEICEKALFTSK